MEHIGRRQVPLAQIDDATRLRPVDMGWAETLARLMEADGQQTPITLRWTPDQDGVKPLIAGGHRLAAARILGWETILAEEVQCSDDEAELLEIDENIARSGLTELERGELLGLRQAAYERLHPETKHGGKRVSGQVAILAAAPLRFTADVAARLKIGERTVQRLVARHKKLAPEVKQALAQSPLANSGTDLDALAKLPAPKQLQVLDRLTATEGAARNVATALAQIDKRREPPAHEKEFAALMSAWRKAGKKARGLFLEHLRQDGAIGAEGGK